MTMTDNLLKGEKEIAEILVKEQTMTPEEKEKGYNLIHRYMTATQFKEKHKETLDKYSSAEIGKVLEKLEYEQVTKRIDGVPTKVRLLPIKTNSGEVDETPAADGWKSLGFDTKEDDERFASCVWNGEMASRAEWNKYIESKPCFPPQGGHTVSAEFCDDLLEIVNENKICYWHKFVELMNNGTIPLAVFNKFCSRMIAQGYSADYDLHNITLAETKKTVWNILMSSEWLVSEIKDCISSRKELADTVAESECDDERFGIKCLLAIGATVAVGVASIALFTAGKSLNRKNT